MKPTKINKKKISQIAIDNFPPTSIFNLTCLLNFRQLNIFPTTSRHLKFQL